MSWSHVVAAAILKLFTFFYSGRKSSLCARTVHWVKFSSEEIYVDKNEVIARGRMTGRKKSFTSLKGAIFLRKVMTCESLFLVQKGGIEEGKKKSFLHLIFSILVIMVLIRKKSFFFNHTFHLRILFYFSWVSHFSFLFSWKSYF